MFDKLINAAFGPSRGGAYLFRQALKFVLCGGVAYGSHTLAFNLMTNVKLPPAASVMIKKPGSGIRSSILLTPANDGRISAFGELLQNAASETKVRAFDIALCGTSSAIRRRCSNQSYILAVTLLPRAIEENAAGANAPEAPEVISEAEYPIIESTGGIAPVVSIQHSVHSITRQIEAVAFNEPYTPASALKLCAGTRRTLGLDECEVGSRIEEAVSKLLTPAINDARWATLLLGPIQLITLALFFFVNLEAFGGLRRYAFLKTALLNEIPGEDGKARFELPDRDDLDNRIQEFNASNMTSIMDEMVAYAILSTHQQALAVQQKSPDEPPPVADGQQPAQATDSVKVATLEGFRDNMVGEAQARIEPLETMNETMMKLAFVGTVIGIGLALMTARSLDAAHPVEEMLTKAAMFGAIGSAFGTTLLGVSLSIMASTTIQMVSTRWMQRIYDAFRIALDQGRRVDPNLASKYGSQLRQKLQKHDQPPSTLGNIGYLVVFGGIVWAIFHFAVGSLAPSGN